MPTAIVGVGNIGSSVARHLVAGGEPVVLTAKDESRAQALAEELGPLARAASVEDAISGAEAVLLAVWLDAMRELIPAYADLLTGKVVIDPSNPIGFDASGQMMRTLPDGESPARSWRPCFPRERTTSRPSARLARTLSPPAPTATRWPCCSTPLTTTTREDNRAADPRGGVRAVEGRRRGCRRPDRSPRRRPAPIRLQRRGRRHRPSPVRYRRFRRLSVAWAEAERSPTATGWRSAASASNWPGTAATTRRTTPTSTSRPRHPHAGQHRPARLGAVLRHQPVGGRPRVYRGPGRRAGLPVEAPHRGAAWAGCAPATTSTCTSATLGRPAPDPLLPVKNDMGGERHGMAGAAAGF